MVKAMRTKIAATSAIVLALVLAFTFALAPASAFADAIYTGEKAASLAKKKVGNSATVVEIDSDYDKGGLMYEVELYKGKKEYNLTYRAKDGKLVKYEWELRSKHNQKRTGANKSKAYIKKKAKKYVSKSTVKSITKKRDDGITEYKVKLRKGSKTYELTYNAKSGSLISYEWKYAKVSTSSKYIGLAKAKSIALKKVPKATIIKAEFDKDDGVPVYEVELVKGYYEYEVVIHAKTGKILECDRDYRWD